jgi:hypothetical protein
MFTRYCVDALQAFVDVGVVHIITASTNPAGMVALTLSSKDYVPSFFVYVTVENLAIKGAMTFHRATCIGVGSGTEEQLAAKLFQYCCMVIKDALREGSNQLIVFFVDECGILIGALFDTFCRKCMRPWTNLVIN